MLVSASTLRSIALVHLPHTKGSTHGFRRCTPQGFKYEIKDGDFAGEIVTIIDNKPVADGQPNQRKVLVTHSAGHDYYILPRQLHDTPVGMAGRRSRARAVPLQVVAVLDRSGRGDRRPAVDRSARPVIVRRIDPITDPMDPRLDHLRPSAQVAQGHRQYQSREMANGMTDIDFFLTFTPTSTAPTPTTPVVPPVVLLKGDTQSGKTMLVEVLAIVWAERLGLPKPMPIFTISGSAGVTDFDLFGQTTSYTDPVTGQETLVWLPGMVELAAQVGGILYLDETNALDPRYTSSLHPLDRPPPHVHQPQQGGVQGRAVHA